MDLKEEICPFRYQLLPIWYNKKIIENLREQAICVGGIIGDICLDSRTLDKIIGLESNSFKFNYRGTATDKILADSKYSCKQHDRRHNTTASNPIVFVGDVGQRRELTPPHRRFRRGSF